MKFYLDTLDYVVEYREPESEDWFPLAAFFDDLEAVNFAESNRAKNSYVRDLDVRVRKTVWLNGQRPG
jgi:hypothetical protein